MPNASFTCAAGGAAKSTGSISVSTTTSLDFAQTAPAAQSTAQGSTCHPYGPFFDALPLPTATFSPPLPTLCASIPVQAGCPHMLVVLQVHAGSKVNDLQNASCPLRVKLQTSIKEHTEQGIHEACRGARDQALRGEELTHASLGASQVGSFLASTQAHASGAQACSWAHRHGQGSTARTADASMAM